MKKIYPLVFILFFVFIFSNNSFAQKLYDDLTPLSQTNGKRLTLSSQDIEPLDLISYKRNDSLGITEFKASLYADYRQWKFTDKFLVAGYAKGNFLRIWSKTPQLVDTGNLGYTRLTAALYGGASYYFSPNKVYVTGAIGGALDRFKLHRDFQELENIDTLVSSSAVWGALGYGRINNREVVEYAYDFDEALINRGVIDTHLDDATLREISVLLYQQREGMFLDRYEDDEYVELFRRIEQVLITKGYISGNLGSAAAVKLYEILRNTSKKYIIYPKYSGYQVQGQIQYQLSNTAKNKPRDHYLSFSGIYTFNLSRKTNVVLSGFFSMPLDTMASGMGMRWGANFENIFQNYLPFLPDRNNLDFYKEYYGTGAFGGTYAPGFQKVMGIRGDAFHSLSSVAGIQGYVMVANTTFKYIDSRPYFGASARFDYNIISSLTSYVKGAFYAQKTMPPSMMFAIGFTYRVF